jgi:hypothetical protein
VSRAKRVLESIRRQKKKGGLVLTLDKLKESTHELREKINAPRPITIRKVTPLAGNKTLTISGEARGTKMYPVTITFYNVDFSTSRDKNHPLTAVVDDMNTTFFMEQVTEDEHPVQIRCQCPDFYFTWWYYDRKRKALSGPDFPAYHRKTQNYPERNEKHAPGLCKHIVGLVERLEKDRILKKASPMVIRPGTVAKPAVKKVIKTSSEAERAFRTR